VDCDSAAGRRRGEEGVLEEEMWTLLGDRGERKACWTSTAAGRQWRQTCWAEVGVGGESMGRQAGEGERMARWMGDGEKSCCGLAERLVQHDLICSWIRGDGCGPLVRSRQRSERFQALDIWFERLRFVGWDALALLK
jgi:hypothetical protein